MTVATYLTSRILKDFLTTASCFKGEAFTGTPCIYLLMIPSISCNPEKTWTPLPYSNNGTYPIIESRFQNPKIRSIVGSKGIFDFVFAILPSCLLVAIEEIVRVHSPPFEVELFGLCLLRPILIVKSFKEELLLLEIALCEVQNEGEGDELENVEPMVLAIFIDILEEVLFV
jgi:hypothetical protein